MPAQCSSSAAACVKHTLHKMRSLFYDRTRGRSNCICGHSGHAMHPPLLLLLLLALGGAAAAQSAVTRARADLREPFRQLRSCLPVTVFVSPPVAGAPRPGSVLRAGAGWLVATVAGTL